MKEAKRNVKKEKSKVMKKEKEAARFFQIAAVLLMAAAIAGLSLATVRYHNRLSEKQKEARALAGEIARLQEELTGLQEELTKAQNREPGAEALPYQTKYPDFYVTPPEQTGLPEKKTIYLTFDDGPSERTDEILEILKRQDVKATFFVIGKTDEAAKKRMKAIVEDGHALAMHSYSHDYKKIYASVDAYLDDMYQIFCLIRDTTGQTPTMFRFPGGSINAYNYNIYQEISAEMLRRGFVPYDWNASSGDAAKAKVKASDITKNIVAGGKKTHRGIVLCHDASAKTETVKGLESAIVQLKEAGYIFDRLSPEIQPVLFSYRE